MVDDSETDEDDRGRMFVIYEVNALSGDM